MKKILKHTFIHRKDKMPYLWTGIGVSALSLFVVAVVLFSQYHQFVFLKINKNLSSAVISSVVVDVTNAERKTYGLETLAQNDVLKKAAQAKADDMAKRGYFSHNTPDGKTPWYWIDQAGYTYKSAGENLAVNFNYSKDVVNAWMNSPTHKENIIKAKYKEIGVGVAEGFYQGKPAIFVVQMFGTPKDGGATLVTLKKTNVSSSTKVLGAYVDNLSLYDLLFSENVKTVILCLLFGVIVLVLSLAVFNPNKKNIIKIAKLSLIPFSLILISYIFLVSQSGSIQTSFIEF